MPSRPTVALPLAECPRITMAATGHHSGGSPGTYHLHDRWCLHVYAWHGRLTVDGVAFAISPGVCSVLPPGAELVYAYGEPVCTHVFAHFRAGASDAQPVSLPLVQDLGPRYQACYHALESVVRFRATNPRRADARLYDLLFTLAELSGPAPDDTRHPVLQPLLEWIDLHLAERFTCDRICREFSLSHNYLNRLCARDLGCTLAAYIHQRRAQWATHLLTTTTLPVKVVAAELGYDDLAQFSKLIRRHTGRAPRALRPLVP